jgi:hypothetical protein
MGTVLPLKAGNLPSRILNITMGVVATPEDMADALRAVIPVTKVRIETPAAAVSLPKMTRPSDLGLAGSVLNYAPCFGLIDALRGLTAWLKLPAETRVCAEFIPFVDFHNMNAFR